MASTVKRQMAIRHLSASLLVPLNGTDFNSFVSRIALFLRPQAQCHCSCFDVHVSTFVFQCHCSLPARNLHFVLEFRKCELNNKSYLMWETEKYNLFQSKEYKWNTKHTWHGSDWLWFQHTLCGNQAMDLLWSWMYPLLLSSSLGQAMLVAWNWPQWEHFHHENWSVPPIRVIVYSAIF